MKNPDECEFLQRKEYYDEIIDVQRANNKEFILVLKNTNEAFEILSNEVKDALTGIKDEMRASNIKISEMMKKNEQFEKQVSELDSCSKENKKEILGLRSHLDNGYQKSLRDAIEETQKKIQTESNKELLEQMMEMVRHVVIGRVDVDKKKTDYFWNWLIKLTATGGLVYMIIAQIARAFGK